MEFNYRNPDRIARALSLTGGGVRGLFSATVLSELERRIGRDLSEQFDVVVGTSVGGIIALGLACGISAKKIASHISASAKDIFGKPARLNPDGLRATRHRPDRLRECIGTILGSSANTKIRELNRNVLIPSVDAFANRIVYFSNVERIGSTPCLNASLIDVALATSAAPTYFPPHIIDEAAFLDGGIASNNPDIEALRFCWTVLSRTLQSLRILSIGTGDVQHVVDRQDCMDAGAIKWMRKYKILDRMMSLQESKSSGLVADLLGEGYLRIDTTFENEISLDDCRDTVLDFLKQRAGDVVAEKWRSDAKRVAELLR